MIDKIDNSIFKSPFSPVFAEVYIEDGKKDEAGSSGIRPAQESITVRPDNPRQEKIAQMRQISRELFRGSISNEKYREFLFYKQAQFMTDYEDDAQQTASFNMYFPCYQLMNDDQLRTYFSWRSRIRAGNVTQTELSYVFLYVYELLNHIGVSIGEEALSKLIAFWNDYRSYTDKLDRYMAAWIRDYYVIFPCPYTFGELLVREPVLQKFYTVDTEALSFESNSELSSYKIRQSVFYTPENEKMIKDCFDYVLLKLDELLGKSGIKFRDLIVDSNVEVPWRPFSNAIFHMKPEYWPRNKKTVKITDDCEYRYRNGRWFSTCAGIYTTNGRQILGYIFKRMEQLLRRATNFKFKLTADDRNIDKMLLDRLLPGLGSSGFLSEIDLAVKEYYVNSRKTVVKVEESNLIKIRQNALITQEKLIVPNTDGEDENGEKQPVAPVPEALPAPKPAYTPAVCDAEPTDIWAAFAGSLEPLEAAALKKMLAGISVTEIIAFLKGSGTMLEVLLDGINQKALDNLGDTILELYDEIVVFDEYRENLRKAVGCE